MRVILEFRVSNDEASKHFAENIGKRHFLARGLRTEKDSLLYERIGRIEREYKKRGDVFVLSWWAERKYSADEISAAELFHLIPTKFFEPAGEEGGTRYDESRACALCHSGAPQVTDLALPTGCIPEKYDLATTIANELVISARLADLLHKNEITGCSIRPVRQGSPNGHAMTTRFQLVVTETTAEIAPQTETGNKPFDKDPNNEHRCRNGDLIGLRLLSEVYIKRSSYSSCDMVATKQFVGLRSGLLRPARIILISQHLRRLLEEHKIKGYRIEVAHLVEE